MNGTQYNIPFATEERQRIVDQFSCNGYYFLDQVLTVHEVSTLKSVIERKYKDPRMHQEEGDHIRGSSLMRMYEYDHAFRDLIVREPLASLAEDILGQDCHMISQNPLRSPPGQAGGWHIDGQLHFPLPDNIPCHGPRIPLPCFVINVLIPLIDVEPLEDGPTQVVLGSHYSGRKPPPEDNPTFNGRKPISLFTKAGGAHMFNS